MLLGLRRCFFLLSFALLSEQALAVARPSGLVRFFRDPADPCEGEIAYRLAMDLNARTPDEFSQLALEAYQRTAFIRIFEEFGLRRMQVQARRLNAALRAYDEALAVHGPAPAARAFLIEIGRQLRLSDSRRVFKFDNDSDIQGIEEQVKLGGGESFEKEFILPARDLLAIYTKATRAFKYMREYLRQLDAQLKLEQRFDAAKKARIAHSVHQATVDQLLRQESGDSSKLRRMYGISDQYISPLSRKELRYVEAEISYIYFTMMKISRGFGMPRTQIMIAFAESVASYASSANYGY